MFRADGLGVQREIFQRKVFLVCLISTFCFLFSVHWKLQLIQ